MRRHSKFCLSILYMTHRRLRHVHRLQVGKKYSLQLPRVHTPDVSPFHTVLPGGSWLLIGGCVWGSGYTQTYMPPHTKTSAYLSSIMYVCVVGSNTCNFYYRYYSSQEYTADVSPHALLWPVTAAGLLGNGTCRDRLLSKTTVIGSRCSLQFSQSLLGAQQETEGLGLSMLHIPATSKT